MKNELDREIKKWTEKLDNKIPQLKPIGDSGKELLNNAKAYRKDSKHFYENEDLIKSYESLIWAWAFIEIGEKFNHLSK